MRNRRTSLSTWMGDVICSSIKVAITIDLLYGVMMKLNLQMMDVDKKIHPVISFFADSFLVSIPDVPVPI